MVERGGTLMDTRRRARIMAAVPDLAEAIAWCKQRRMGVKLVSLEGTLSADFIAEVQAYDSRLGGSSDVESIVVNNKHGFTSHRLVFKHPYHAFEFKMRWL